MNSVIEQYFNRKNESENYKSKMVDRQRIGAVKLAYAQPYTVPSNLVMNGQVDIRNLTVLSKRSVSGKKSRGSNAPGGAGGR